MREYLLYGGSDIGRDGGQHMLHTFVAATRQELLDIGDKKLLVWQKAFGNNYVPIVIVPGYVVSDIYITPKGKKGVKCRPVPEEEREGLVRIIEQHGFKGQINFND